MTLSNIIDREIAKYKVYVSENKVYEANRSYCKIESYVMNAIRKESNNYSYEYTTPEYVIQDMRLELLNAINKYDVEKGIKFITYFTGIMKSYRLNTYSNIENIYNKIYIYYPESRSRNTLSYDVSRSYNGEEMSNSFIDTLVDTKSNNIEDNINIVESLSNHKKLDDLDMLILSTIISDDSSINKGNTGKSHRLNRDYIMDACNITKATLQSKLSKYRRMNLVESMLKDVYRGIEDLPRVSTLDNLVDQSLDLDDTINAIAI